MSHFYFSIILFFALFFSSCENKEIEWYNPDDVEFISAGAFTVVKDKSIAEGTQFSRLLADAEAISEVLQPDIISSIKDDYIWVGVDATNAPEGLIMVPDLADYYKKVVSNQPMLLLNRISRVYCDKYFDQNTLSKLTDLYSANASKYKKNYMSNGIKLVMNQAPDAGTDMISYFAELSEAYFGENDFYPFDYFDLQRYDATGFAFMESIWGTRSVADNPNGITLPPASLKQWLEYKQSPLDLFYSRYLDADGLPIVASRFVSDEALLQARYIVREMTKKIPGVIDVMVEHHFRVGVIGADENVTDLPENRIMPKVWPGTDWDKRGRGYGATDYLPLMSIGEENLIELSWDWYYSESIMVHEFAHNVDFALRLCKDGFEKELEQAYANAIKTGLWKDSYSATNSAEYFAEGAQAWYDTCRMVVKISGKDTTIKYREQLKSYDPALYAIMESVFPPEKLEGYHFTYE